MTIGRLSEKDQRYVAVLRGRFHLYEGYEWEDVTLAARTIVEWGVPNLLLTNAAGGPQYDFFSRRFDGLDRLPATISIQNGASSVLSRLFRRLRRRLKNALNGQANCRWPKTQWR